MSKQVYAIYINAKNDANGNPRRGWLCYDRSANFLGFVDEKHAYISAVFPDAIVLASIPTTPGFYRDVRRAHV